MVTTELRPGTSQFPQDRSSIPLAAKEIKTSENCRFLDHIGRPDLKEVLSSSEPWAYVTAEFYGQGIKGQGGLGMLAGDTFETAVKLNLPMIFLTPFYRWERSYELDNHGRQREVYKEVAPEERGFARTSINECISTCIDPVVNLDFYKKDVGSVKLLVPTEKNIGELYEGCPESDRRLYQNVSFCFGGYKALKSLNVTPSLNQVLNEAPATFFALARLDDIMTDKKVNLATAIKEVRSKSIFTNHTLVQAAEPLINLRQFQHFVMPNIKNEELNLWLYKKIDGKGGAIRLSTLIFDLAGKKNGVSRLHAEEASKKYFDYDGKLVPFDAVTNGIAIDRWGEKGFLDYYREKGVLDSYDLPDIEKVDLLQEAELIVRKEKYKQEMRAYLQTRKDQNGNPILIPEDAKVADWRRRIANYKRPGLIFKDPEKLAKILEEENIHFVMAGNVHPADEPMKKELERILKLVDGNEILKQRVHFIQDYDEELGKTLARGADFSINTPVVGQEACGTSGMKDMLNCVMVISTEDGWLADPAVKARSEGKPIPEPAYLRISGNNEEEEVESIRHNLKRGSKILSGKGDISWGKYINDQFRAYLPIISGSRMGKDYLNLAFPEVIVYSSSKN